MTKKNTAEKVKLWDDSDEPRKLYDIIDDLGLFVDDTKLNELKIVYVLDFGETEKEAKDRITIYLEMYEDDNQALTALKKSFMTLWKRTKEHYAEHKRKEKAKPLDIPKLPEDEKFDLTKPEIEVGGITYELPISADGPGIEKGEYPKPLQFELSQWIALFRSTNLLYGLDLGKALSPKAEHFSARAMRPALSFVMPKRLTDAFTTQVSSRKNSLVTYSERLSSGIHNMLIGGEVHGTSPYVSAQASGKYVNQQGEAQASSKMFVNAYWIMPFVEIRLSECTVASNEFIEAAQKAVNADHEGNLPTMPTGSALSKQFDALKKVFDTYGHVMSETVSLGGTMYFTSEELVDSSTEKSQVEIVAKLAVEVKAGSGGGGGSATFKKKDGKEVTDKDLSTSQSWTAHGGDRTLVSNPKEWSKTLYDPDLWAVCERQNTLPLVTKLPDQLQNRVNDVWEAGLNTLWGGRGRPINHEFPILENRPFQIRTGTKMTDSALRAVGTRYVKKTGWADIYAFKDVGGKKLKEKDFYWTLVYSGFTEGAEGTGEPYYFIVTWVSKTAAESLRKLGQPGKECNALAGWDTHNPVHTGHGVAHACQQNEVWAKYDIIADERRLDDLLWTVVPIVDEHADETDFKRYRVRSRGNVGRLGLDAKIDKRNLEHTFPDKKLTTGFMRISDDEDTKIFLVPHES